MEYQSNLACVNDGLAAAGATIPVEAGLLGMIASRIHMSRAGVACMHGRTHLK